MTEPADDEEALNPPEPASEPEPRKRKKKRRATPDAHTAPAYEWRRGEHAGKSWTTGQVLAALVVGMAVGGFGGYSARGGQPGGATLAQAAPTETVQGPRLDPSAAAAAAAAPAPGGADKFGRPPGDEHYGHDHPPQQPGAAPAAPAAAPAPGPDGKDSFGRAPGNEHFGHNHP